METQYRSYPSTFVEHIGNKLDLSRIQPLRQTQIHFECPAQFNNVINEDVKYSTKPYTSHRNRVLTKFENKYPVSNDIALYHTHTHELNAEEKLGTRMFEQQRDRAEKKVLQKEDWRVPQSQVIAYNDDLPGVYRQSGTQVTSRNFAELAHEVDLALYNPFNANKQISYLDIMQSLTDDNGNVKLTPAAASLDLSSIGEMSEPKQTMKTGSLTHTLGKDEGVKEGFISRYTSDNDEFEEAVNTTSLRDTLYTPQSMTNDRTRVSFEDKYRYDPNSDTFVLNKGYQPRLKQTEQFQDKPVKPIIIDERMIWHTSDKPYMLESDKQQMAIALQPNNNPYIQERNQRQKESDDAFLNRHQTLRWTEDKMAYMDRLHLPHYGIDDMVSAKGTGLGQLTLAPKMTQDRHALTQEQTIEAFGKERLPLDLSSIHTLEKEYAGKYNAEFDRQIKEVGEEHLLAVRKEGFEHGYEGEDVKGQYLLARITDPIKRLLGLKKTNVHDKDARLESVNKEAGKTYVDETIVADANPMLAGQERFVYKPNHMIVFKDDGSTKLGANTADMPSDMHLLATSYQTVDPTGMNKIRQVIYLDDKTIYIVQRRGQEQVYTIVDLPIDKLTTDMRQRIGDTKAFATRSKVAEFEYEDVVKFFEYAVTHPERSMRVNLKDITQYIRQPDITAFDNPKIEYVDYNVYNLDNVNKRQKTDTPKLSGRVDLHQDITKVPSVTEGFNPLSSSNRKEQFRNENKKHPLGTRNGVKRGRFD